VQIISGTTVDLHGDVITRMARYRHRIFIERLGWQLRCENSLEFDQFDRDDTLYVVAENDAGQVIGTGRLLPTLRPYLLGDIFPQLMNGAPVPCSPQVWELSRFAAMDLEDRAVADHGQLSSPVAVGLLRAALECAARHGAQHVITVSPIGVERLLRKAGFRAHRAGAPVMIDGSPVVACWISTSELPPH
jgi:N-acyl-L-homoserine lactone synthetase